MSKKLNLELRRALDPSTGSGQGNGLVEFAQLLYTWIIPHTDDWGRLEADAFTVKMVVMPASERTVEEFEAALAALDQVHALQLYPGTDGARCLQMSNWDEFQAGLHKRTDSKFPEPPPRAESPGDSGKFPEVPGKGGKVVDKPGSPSPEDEVEDEVEVEDSISPPKPPSENPKGKAPVRQAQGRPAKKTAGVNSSEKTNDNGKKPQRAQRAQRKKNEAVRDAMASDWSEQYIQCVDKTLPKAWRGMIDKKRPVQVHGAYGRFCRMMQCQPRRVLAAVLDVKHGKKQPKDAVQAMQWIFWRLNEGVAPNDDHYVEATKLLRAAEDG